MLEPQFTGMTLHETTSKIDGGDVIFQTSSPVFAADGIHENACRVVSEFSNLFVSRLINVEVESIKGISPTTTGRIWTSRMWSPHHLQVVYEKFENKINAYALENGLDKPKSRLVDVLV
jgi:methionyl-tRNA formyltransferase